MTEIHRRTDPAGQASRKYSRRASSRTWSGASWTSRTPACRRAPASPRQSDRSRSPARTAACRASGPAAPSRRTEAVGQPCPPAAERRESRPVVETAVQLDGLKMLRVAGESAGRRRPGWVEDVAPMVVAPAGGADPDRHGYPLDPKPRVSRWLGPSSTTSSSSGVTRRRARAGRSGRRRRARRWCADRYSAAGRGARRGSRSRSGRAR